MSNKGNLAPNDTFTAYYRNERIIGRDNFNIELCPPGTYLEDGGKEICDKCLLTGNCTGGYRPVVPKYINK